MTRELSESSGQATLEYLVLISVLVSIFLLMLGGLRGAGLAERLTSWLSSSYRAAYTYGHVKARGPDEGGPKYHPRIEGEGENNFRLFINPAN